MLLLPIYLIMLSIIGLIIREARYKNETCRRFFMPALLAHFVGVLAFDAIYIFYYDGGDTTYYHQGALVINQALIDDFNIGWQLMTLGSEERNFQIAPYIDKIGGYYRSSNTLIVLRIAAFFQLFTFQSFWLTSLFFACIGFLGLWALFRVMLLLYPDLETKMAMATLFVPSVLFWGSGIMKDTLSIAFLGFLVYGVYHLLIKRDQILLPLLLIPTTALSILSLKAYIIVGFIPALTYWLISIFFSLVRDPQLKSAIRFLAIIGLGVLIYFNQDTIWYLSDTIMQQFIQLAISFQSWHGFLTEVLEHSSGYSLGEIEFTPWGILKKFPTSVNITLFRPYLTEVSNPVMLFSAMESTILMLATIYVLLHVGILRTFSIIVRHPFAMFCLLFSLLFAFAVGFASYNFGALVRYKIPCMPFYIALLFIIPYHYKQEKKLPISI